MCNLLWEFTFLCFVIFILFNLLTYIVVELVLINLPSNFIL